VQQCSNCTHWYITEAVPGFCCLLMLLLVTSAATKLWNFKTPIMLEWNSRNHCHVISLWCPPKRCSWYFGKHAYKIGSPHPSLDIHPSLLDNSLDKKTMSCYIDKSHQNVRKMAIEWTIRSNHISPLTDKLVSYCSEHHPISTLETFFTFSC